MAAHGIASFFNAEGTIDISESVLSENVDTAISIYQHNEVDDNRIAAFRYLKAVAQLKLARSSESAELFSEPRLGSVRQCMAAAKAANFLAKKFYESATEAVGDDADPSLLANFFAEAVAYSKAANRFGFPETHFRLETMLPHLHENGILNLEYGIFEFFLESSVSKLAEPLTRAYLKVAAELSHSDIEAIRAVREEFLRGGVRINRAQMIENLKRLVIQTNQQLAIYYGAASLLGQYYLQKALVLSDPGCHVADPIAAERVGRAEEIAIAKRSIQEFLEEHKAFSPTRVAAPGSVSTAIREGKVDLDRLPGRSILRSTHRTSTGAGSPRDDGEPPVSVRPRGVSFAGAEVKLLRRGSSTGSGPLDAVSEGVALAPIEVAVSPAVSRAEVFVSAEPPSEETDAVVVQSAAEESPWIMNPFYGYHVTINPLHLLKDKLSALIKIL